MLVQFGGPVELTLGRRDAVRIFKPLVGAEQTNLDLAPRDFVQIDLIGTAVASRYVLE